jgi:hypothetical protein
LDKGVYWQSRFDREFVKVPGQHLVVSAPTGAGKTNFFFWTLHSLLKERYNKPVSKWETIVWFDIRKSSEILSLCCAFKIPVRIIIPEMMDIHIELFDDETYQDIERVYVQSERDIWSNISKERVNIVAFEGFIRDIDRMVPFVKKTFSQLIDMALDYHLNKITPMAIFYDEFHNIAPSKGNAATSDIFKYGGDIQLNVEKLRSAGIRFVISCHKWTELRPGIRNSMMFIAAMRGANFPSAEQPKLSRFNRKFEKLNIGEVMIAYPNRTLSDPISLPLYPTGKDYGYVFYKGRLLPPERKQRSDPNMISIKSLASLLTEVQNTASP